MAVAKARKDKPVGGVGGVVFEGDKGLPCKNDGSELEKQRLGFINAEKRAKKAEQDAKEKK